MDAHDGQSRYTLLIVAGLTVLGSTVPLFEARSGWFDDYGPEAAIRNAPQIAPPPVQGYSTYQGYGAYPTQNYNPPITTYQNPSDLQSITTGHLTTIRDTKARKRSAR